MAIQYDVPQNSVLKSCCLYIRTVWTRFSESWVSSESRLMHTREILVLRSPRTCRPVSVWTLLRATWRDFAFTCATRAAGELVESKSSPTFPVASWFRVQGFRVSGTLGLDNMNPKACGLNSPASRTSHRAKHPNPKP